jgi:hypothetical protein
VLGVSGVSDQGGINSTRVTGMQASREMKQCGVSEFFRNNIKRFVLQPEP